jgi:hypothetical protein
MAPKTKQGNRKQIPVKPISQRHTVQPDYLLPVTRSKTKASRLAEATPAASNGRKGKGTKGKNPKLLASPRQRKKPGNYRKPGQPAKQSHLPLDFLTSLEGKTGERGDLGPLNQDKKRKREEIDVLNDADSEEKPPDQKRLQTQTEQPSLSASPSRAKSQVSSKLSTPKHTPTPPKISTAAISPASPTRAQQLYSPDRHPTVSISDALGRYRLVSCDS